MNSTSEATVLYSIPHASSSNGHNGLSVSPTNPTSPVNKESGLAHDNSELPPEESASIQLEETAPTTAELNSD